MLSVILPAYNAKDSIKKCIESVLMQKYEDFELIIIDDGSTDGTSAICDEYAKNDKRIRVIHQDNHGLLSSRCIGVRAARGEYIGFVDADDWIEPEYYEILMSELKDSDIISSGAIKLFTDENGREETVKNKTAVGSYSSENALTELYKNMLCCSAPFEFGILPYMWNKIFRKDILLPILERVDKRIFDGEDASLSYVYLLKSEKITLSDYCGYHYMIHNQSMSNKKRAHEFYNESCLYMWLYDQFSNSKYKEVLIPQLNRYMLMMLWKRNPEMYIEENKFVFPVERIPYGSKVVIYGAGDMGKAYVAQNNQNHHCDIVAWADRRHESVQISKGIKCIPPNEISREVFDYILIAINSSKISHSVSDWLERNDIPQYKIISLFG